MDDNADSSDFMIPQDNRFRKFPANFVTTSMSLAQGMMEFFEAPPNMIVDMLHNKKTRPNASVKHIVSIIMQPALMLHFFNRTKGLLEPLKDFSIMNELN